MQSVKPLVSLSCLAVIMSLAAHADVILPPGSLWEYSTDLGATWNSPSPAPFGNYTSSGPGDAWDPPGHFDYQTYWPQTGNLWVRTTVDLTGRDLATIHYALGVDNGYKLYANNHFVSEGYAEGYTYRWEYSGQIPPADLVGGRNELLVKLEDNGGLTAFDLELTSEAVPSGVPDTGATL